MRLLFTLCLITLNYTSYSLSYCVPVPANGVNGHSVSNIFLESINSAGDTTSSFSFFPDTLSTQTCFLHPGLIYSLSIAGNSNHSSSTYAAWIDWNNDTTLSASEKLGEYTATGPGQNGTITFTVPLNSVTGKLRLRVRCSNASSIGACTNSSSGQTSDFTITVLNNNLEYNFFIGWEFSSTGTNYINGVTLGGISNQNSGTANGPVYQDYTAFTANVNSCVLVNFEIQTVAPSSFLNRVDIYVDLNNDGNFTIDEIIHTFNPPVGTNLYSGNFLLPAITGNHRLRICFYTDAGLSEVEDYSLIISSSTTSAIPGAAISSNMFYDCTGGCRFIGCTGINYFQDMSCGVPTSWHWSVPGATPDSSNQKNPSFSFTPGTYILTLITSNALGSDTVTATIEIRQPFTSFSLGNDTSVCAGDSIIINAPFSTGSDCFLYHWSTGEISDHIVVRSSGTYSVRLDTCTHAACQSIDSVHVDFSPLMYALTGGGFYCSGTAAPSVGLADSQTGVNYQLLRNGNIIGTSIPGTGHAISFGVQIQNGTYTVQATSVSNNCTATMTGSVSVTMNPLPQRFLVVGGGTFCAGNGAIVSVNGSQANVSYQLYIDWNQTGSPIVGNGGTINFPPHSTSGTYTVIGTNTNTNCADTMNGNAVIVSLPGPQPYQMVGGGNFCSGSANAAVGITNSDSGAIYILIRDTVPTGDTLIGTGSAISFSNLTNSGVYTISATTGTACIAMMIDSAVLTVKPSPAVFNVTGTGTYCFGGNPVIIGIDSSQVLVNYRLWTGGFPTGGVVPGTGTALAITSTIIPGTYNVVATNTSNACTATMNGVATIVVDSFPIVFNVTGGGSFCEGDSGVAVGLDSSVTGVEYYLYWNGDTTGISLNGTGLALNFGLIDSAGQVTVIATNANQCSSAMSGSALINVNMLPVCSVTPLTEDTVCIYHSPLPLMGNPAGGQFSGTGVSNSLLIPLAAGAGTAIFTYDYTDSLGCSSSASDSVVIDLCIGIDEQLTLNNCKVYPNPANDKFIAEFEVLKQGYTIEIFNSVGTLIKSIKSGSGSGKILYPVVTSDLSGGMYLMRITLAEEVHQFPVMIVH